MYHVFNVLACKGCQVSFSVCATDCGGEFDTHEPCSWVKVFFGWLINFNGMLICLELFYAKFLLNMNNLWTSLFYP